MTVESDDLDVRAGLPVAFRYLETALPRDNWSARRLHPSAQHWLEIHDYFRSSMGGLVDLGLEWREQRLEAAAYHGKAVPRLRSLLGSLHGHHGIESHSYFPAFAAMEPAMAAGFDLLDRDHAAIEQLMNAMWDAAVALDRAVAEPAGEDLSPLAAALAAGIERATGLIGRHLHDEEDIIVPMLTLRGDPYGDW